MLPTYETVEGRKLESQFLGFLKEHRQSVIDTMFEHMPRTSDIRPMGFDLDSHWRMVVDYPERQGKYVRPGLLSKCFSRMGAGE